MKLPETELGTSSRATEPPRTNNQIKATAIADGLAVKAKWKTLLAEAKAVWEKVPAEGLAKVDGTITSSPGLVQLRYQISREESDRQLRDFFRQALFRGLIDHPAKVRFAVVARRR